MLNKIDKPITQLTKMKEWEQQNEENQKRNGEVTTDPSEIQIIRKS